MKFLFISISTNCSDITFHSMTESKEKRNRRKESRNDESLPQKLILFIH